MVRNPLVSVVIPCYNQAEYLPEAVESVVSQTMEDWECIIINDGSTDNTRDAAMSLTAHDHRIRYIERSNGGLAAARNLGIDAARGRYIQFLDADDVIMPKKFEMQLKELSFAAEPAIAFSDYYYCYEDKTPYPDHPCYNPPNLNLDYPLHDMALRWEIDLCIPVHTFLFDACLFKDHDIRFDERLPNHEDWDCWMSILRHEPLLLYIDKKLAAYRIHEGTITCNHVRMRTGFLRAIAKQKRLAGIDEKTRRILSDKIKITKKAYRSYSPLHRTYRCMTAPFKFALKRALPQETLEMLKSALR